MSEGSKGGITLLALRGTRVKFEPRTGTDFSPSMSGVLHSVSTKYQYLTAMTEYEDKSFEELRAEDYDLIRTIDEDISSCKGAKLLVKNIGDALENPRFSDVTLKVGDTEFQAHKLILANRSTVFDAMFSGEMRESRENVVNLVGIKQSTAKEMLRYMYTGKVPGLSMDSATDLYVVADRYDMPELKKLCRDFLVQHITPDFVCEIAVVADLHGDNDLEKACKRTMKNDLKAVLRSDKWAARSKENPVFYFLMLQDVLLDDSYSFTPVVQK